MFAPNDVDMLMFEELDVAGPHEPIDHEADEPMQVSIDVPVIFKNLPTAAVFFGERLGHGFAYALPCKTHKISVFGN